MSNNLSAVAKQTIDAFKGADAIDKSKAADAMVAAHPADDGNRRQYEAVVKQTIAAFSSADRAQSLESGAPPHANP